MQTNRMASSDSQGPAWHPWHYAEAAPSADHALPHPPGYHYPTLTWQHDGEAQHDPRLFSIVQHNANLEFSVLKLLESNYQGKALRRWADGYIQTFGHDVGDAEALGVVLWNAGIDGDAAKPFVATLVSALRDAQSAQPASANRRGREPSQRRAPPEPAPSAVAAARRRADSPLPESAARERLHAWLQAPAIEDINATKRRRIVGQRALLNDFPLRTPEARDAWANAFCDAYFPQKQEFFFEDVSPILTEVLQSQFGLTDAGQIGEEVSRLMIALSKVGACNTKRRRAKPQTQRARRGSTEPAALPSPS